MTDTEQLTITLDRETAARLHEKVESGAYQSESQAIAEALDLLDGTGPAFDLWLRQEVTPVYERHLAGLEPTHTLEEVMGRLELRMRRREAEASSNAAIRAAE